ncbi:JmjC domain-containing protein [Pendulispora albinea]|uniref:Cupin domain-containing protein n=1 Tax=Pendulispora albinea TaxID=2741071 RepID=A0ABZ2LKF6_9BACT
MTVPLIGLADWFAPLGLERFQREILGQQPYFVGPRLEIANRLSRTLAIGTVDDLLSLRGAKVYAWFQKLDGAHTAAPIPSTSGKRFYDAGTTLYFRRIPQFAAHEREVADTLGIPRETAECAVFCNRPGATTRAHFDRADLIMIQLKGRKTWKIAPNTFAPMPLEAWATLDRVPPEVRRYAQGLPPREIPCNATSYDLEQGSILYVPRGYWHETFSDQDSVSLHIQLASPTRLDVLIAALKNELARDEWWRQPAYSLSAGDPHALELASTACKSLVDAASRLDALDIIRPTAREHAIEASSRFTRSALVSFGVDTINPQTDTTRVVISTYGFREKKTAHLEMSVDYVSACRWVDALATGATFTFADLLRAAPSLSDDEAKALLHLLEKTHLVRRQEGLRAPD